MSNSVRIQRQSHRPATPILLSTAAVLIGLTTATSAVANSVYRCESNAGVVEYSNSKPKHFDADQCEKIELPELTTIQSTKPAPASASRSVPQTRPSVGDGFPSVSSARQARRDKARRSILRQELKREQARLAELQEEYRDGEPERRGDERNYQKYLDRVERLRADISRRESSISALTKEMGALN